MFCFFFCKQKTAYEMRISDWSSDVCSSDLARGLLLGFLDVPLDTATQLRVVVEPVHQLAHHGRRLQFHRVRVAQPVGEMFLGFGHGGFLQPVCQGERRPSGGGSAAPRNLILAGLIVIGPASGSRSRCRSAGRAGRGCRSGDRILPPGQASPLAWASAPVLPSAAASGSVSPPPAWGTWRSSPGPPAGRRHRSEEHTSELQSLMRSSYAVFCLKKKKNINTRT